MLWFVGLGISGSRSVPGEAAEVISKADIVYLEQFTSPVSGSELAKIRRMSGGRLRTAKRWLVEDGGKILREAKKNTVVLLSYGDPYVATTHAELRTRAAREKIRTRSIHASSSLTSAVGECGLHFYKIGRVATIMGGASSLATPYYVTYKNLVEGNHTVLLLEYDQDRGFFLDPVDALEGMIRTEKGQRRNVVGPSTFAVVASRVGLRGQAVVCGKISSLVKADFGRPPHTLIVPGRLHFTEADALRALCTCLDEPRDNSEKTTKISVQMLERYVPMVRDALEEVRPHYSGKKEYDTILENAELYVRDAEKFLEDGHDEVAVLSIGYADGLVDALRLAKGHGPGTQGHR